MSPSRDPSGLFLSVLYALGMQYKAHGRRPRSYFCLVEMGEPLAAKAISKLKYQQGISHSLKSKVFSRSSLMTFLLLLCVPQTPPLHLGGSSVVPAEQAPERVLPAMYRHTLHRRKLGSRKCAKGQSGPQAEQQSAKPHPNLTGMRVIGQ